MALPKYVTRRVVQQGPPVAKHPWSIQVVRRSAISAWLTEICKEIEQQPPVQPYQDRLPAVLREGVWQRVDQVKDTEDKVQLLSLAIRTCSAPLIDKDSVAALASEAEL